jgi:hypothetical protein
MSDPNAEKSDKEVAEGQGERVWNQWAPTDAEVRLAAEAAAARAAEGTQTLPAYPEGASSEPYTGTDEVQSVDEAREEAKAQAEAEREERKEGNAAEREQRKAQQQAEVEARKEAKKTQK